MQAVKGRHGTVQQSYRRNRGGGRVGLWDSSDFWYHPLLLCWHQQQSGCSASFLEPPLISKSSVSKSRLVLSHQKSEALTNKHHFSSPVWLLLYCRAPSWLLTPLRRLKWPGRSPAVGSGVRSVPTSEWHNENQKQGLHENVLFFETTSRLIVIWKRKY